MEKSKERRDDAGNITENIDNTFHSIELANEMIARTSDAKTKEALSDKNERNWAAKPDLKKER